MTAAVELREVTVRHRRTTILDRVSFSLAAGSFLAVLGPNGAGKTTLLNALPGFTRFTGEVRVLGAEVARLSPLERGRLRKRIGYVPQLHARAPSVMPLSVREVVEMGRAGICGLSHSLTAHDRNICSEVMRNMELDRLADRPFGVLSGGEQRKVHLARTLAQQPELLLLDEPTGHLDLRWQETLTQLIGRVWRATNITVIMVTHDPRHLPAGVTHAAVLNNGRCVGMGAPADVMDAGRLSELYGLPLRVLETGGRYVVLPEDLE
ncbi:MAG: ABC transporter ATP-binding protein [Kiritimatiellae bacterium]|nr:ABC transporter ATP-binding protein [Kiritimatiellia bacterium]